MNKNYIAKLKTSERIIHKAKELTESGYGKIRITTKGEENANHSISEEGNTKERK